MVLMLRVSNCCPVARNLVHWQPCDSVPVGESAGPTGLSSIRVPGIERVQSAKRIIFRATVDLLEVKTEQQRLAFYFSNWM